MPSAIDITKPIYGTPTTQSVRDNFHIARDEITDLQNSATSHVNRSGDTMTGPLILYGPPYAQNEATTLAWVLQQLHSTINTLIYVGDYDGATDVILSSGQAQFVVGTALPIASPTNSQFYFTVKTGHASPGIGNQPAEGCTAGTFLLSNGVKWINYAMTAANITAKTTPVDLPAIPNVPGANVYDALYGIGQNFLLKTGGTLTGDLILYGPPTVNLGAATKKYVDDKVAALVFPSEAPIDAFSYARANAGWINNPTFTKLRINTDTWGHLGLYSSIASATANQILGYKDNVIRWAVHVGNNATTHDFDIWRYNDAGTAYDTAPIVSITRATGNFIVRSNLFLDPPVSGTANIYGRGLNNPTNPQGDGLNLWSRNGVTSSVIGLRGPTHPNANGIDLYTGTTTSINWQFRQDGVLGCPGSVYIPTSSSMIFGNYSSIRWDGTNFVLQLNTDWQMYATATTGAWTWDGYPNHDAKMQLSGNGDLWIKGQLSGGSIYMNGGITSQVTVTGNYVMSQAGRFAVAGNLAYYVGRNVDDGRWYFVENNSVTFQVTTGGIATATGHLMSANNVYAGGDWNFYLGFGAGGKIISYYPNYYLEWASATGIMQYVLNATQLWIMRNDWWCYNNVGPIGGHGPHQDLSDERTKENITLATDVGLNEILQINPIRFHRVRSVTGKSVMDGPSMNGRKVDARADLGFSAQQLQPIIPEAVSNFGIELPDGTGGIDSEEPTLAMATTPIVAALVNAVKELSARVISLEATLAPGAH